jgi:outer membrane protein OmpA-like peptidoglycan-associated protein
MRATQRLLLGTAAVILMTQVHPAAAQRGITIAQAQAPASETDPHAKKKEPGQHPGGTPQQRPGGPPGQPPAAQGQPGQHPPAKEAQPPAPAPTQRPAQAQPPAAPAPSAPTTKQPTQAQPPAKQLPPPTAPTAQPHPAPTPQPPAAQQQPAPSPTQPKQAQPPVKQLPTPTAPTAQQPAPQSQPPAAQQQPAPGQPRQAQPPAKQLPTPTAPTAQQPAPSPQPPAAQTTPPAGAPTPPPAAQQQPAPGQPAAPGQAAPRPGALPPGAQPAPAAALPGPLAPAPQANVNARRLDEVRTERREVREGDRTVIREPGRVIIQEGGRTIIRHDESDRFRLIARDVRTERRGNETVTVAVRPDGTQVISVVDENGRLLRRSRRFGDGREVMIIDNRYQGPSASYYVDLPPPVLRIPRERYIVEAERASEADIYAALIAPPVDRIERRYTLDEIRYSPQLRDRMPRVDVDTVNFDSGSWEVAPDQMQRLAPVAQAIQQAVQRNPSEVFLIEGHTDAVGADVDNLSLSDRRAESVAVVLTQQFQVPAENLTTQGYGEQNLKIPTQAAERQNRRVTVRRITPLLTGNGPNPGG